jgi:CrcB protein
VIGLIAEASAATEALTPELRLLLATGFCGGFTTMSSFMYETVQMARAQEYMHAAIYLGATIAGSALAFGIGSILVKLVLKSTGGLWN